MKILLKNTIVFQLRKIFFDEVINKVENIDTYFQSYDNKGKCINPCGVTLIPPQSLLSLINVIYSLENSNKAKSLIKLINKAHKENKFIICFGI